jgi:hypothetical protein
MPSLKPAEGALKAFWMNLQKQILAPMLESDMHHEFIQVPHNAHSLGVTPEQAIAYPVPHEASGLVAGRVISPDTLNYTVIGDLTPEYLKALQALHPSIPNVNQVEISTPEHLYTRVPVDNAWGNLSIDDLDAFKRYCEGGLL